MNLGTHWCVTKFKPYFFNQTQSVVVSALNPWQGNAGAPPQQKRKLRKKSD